uniref:DC-STAMP domain-containing protein 2-like n=1 Tax=Solea senegalensis TaxID=28829 RepID=UPI001CD84076|nr:DC-STAMP domain-containing protein 2-like [Solea senegalensis]
METGDKRRHMKCDVTIVQVEGGGVRRTVRGVLSRSAGLSHRFTWRRVKGHMVEGGWSLVGFVSGLLLACVYGVMAVFVQQQSLWVSVHSSLVVALPASFSMGLSAAVRAVVTVMLPSLCSARGRHFLLFLFVSLLVSGPITNVFENTERAAASLLCGAELTANQTQELMQRSATPLFSALDRIREISSNVYSVANRVQNLIFALTDGVRHVARILRNVLHFLADIGDVCNEKVGSPYRKCRRLFTEAQSDCSHLLGDFNFLCDIISAFMPLCNIAYVGDLFCLIPSYVARVLRTRLATPVVAAFERMKRQFEFNISASVTFDLDADSSRSPQQMTQDIMAEISSDLQLFRRLSEPLKYAGLMLLTLAFYRAAQYRRQYLRDLVFDNIYITAQFKELDQQVTSEGGATALPITRREAKTYISPLSWSLSSNEQRAVLVGVVSVFKHLVVGSLMVALDFLVFWVLDQVRHLVTEDVVARAPVTVAMQVNGSGFASDIFRDLVSSFNVLQQGNITVISRKCLLQPSEPDHNTCLLLGFLLGQALLVSLIGGFVQRCPRLICASYYPHREQERIQFLHQQILAQRKVEGAALRRCAVRSLADQGGGAGRGRSLLQTLLLWLPGGGVYLSRLLGVTSPLTCLSCGEELKSKDTVNAVKCDVPQCPGLLCRPCFDSLGNMCVVCTRPLTFQEDNEEELDSSDDEQLVLWSAALRSNHITNPRVRALTDRRVAMATPSRPRPSEPSDRGVRVELSEIDQDQDQTTSEESHSNGSFYSIYSPRSSRHQEEALLTVVVQRPDCPQTLQDPVQKSV